MKTLAPEPAPGGRVSFWSRTRMRIEQFLRFSRAFQTSVSFCVYHNSMMHAKALINCYAKYSMFVSRVQF